MTEKNRDMIDSKYATILLSMLSSLRLFFRVVSRFTV